jgi:hypothetical protein
MIRDGKEFHSYVIVEYNEDVGFDEYLNVPEDDDMVAWDRSHDEPYPFQILGECECRNGDSWHEVLAGVYTESEAKRYVEAIERADILTHHIQTSLDSTLETIQKEDNQ